MPKIDSKNQEILQNQKEQLPPQEKGVWDKLNTILHYLKDNSLSGAELYGSKIALETGFNITFASLISSEKLARFTRGLRNLKEGAPLPKSVYSLDAIGRSEKEKGFFYASEGVWDQTMVINPNLIWRRHSYPPELKLVETKDLGQATMRDRIHYLKTHINRRLRQALIEPKPVPKTLRAPAGRLTELANSIQSVEVTNPDSSGLNKADQPIVPDKAAGAFLSRKEAAIKDEGKEQYLALESLVTTLISRGHSTFVVSEQPDISCKTKKDRKTKQIKRVVKYGNIEMYKPNDSVRFVIPVGDNFQFADIDHDTFLKLTTEVPVGNPPFLFSELLATPQDPKRLAILRERGIKTQSLDQWYENKGNITIIGLKNVNATRPHPLELIQDPRFAMSILVEYSEESESVGINKHNQK